MNNRVKLSDKMSTIDPSAHQKRDSDSASPKKTGVGLVMTAIAGNQNLQKELATAQQNLTAATSRLEEYEGAELAKLLDPKLIRRSRWANRDMLNFQGTAWEEFKEEIRSAGCNIQPIKVRRLVNGKPNSKSDGTAAKFEIVYGHRRHQACLDLGIQVKAIIVDEMDDQELFAQMDRENRSRENLSAWEQGAMYLKALNENLFTSIRQLSEKLGVNHSNASRSIKVAQLPDAVVKAFPSPMVIQVRWAKPLSDALQKDPEGVLQRALELQKERNNLAPGVILERLVAHNQPVADTGFDIQVKGQLMASFRRGTKKAVLEFELAAVPTERQTELQKLIAEFLQKS